MAVNGSSKQKRTKAWTRERRAFHLRCHSSRRLRGGMTNTGRASQSTSIVCTQAMNGINTIRLTMIMIIHRQRWCRVTSSMSSTPTSLTGRRHLRMSYCPTRQGRKIHASSAFTVGRLMRIVRSKSSTANGRHHTSVAFDVNLSAASYSYTSTSKGIVTAADLCEAARGKRHHVCHNAEHCLCANHKAARSTCLLEWYMRSGFGYRKSDNRGTSDPMRSFACALSV
mmetsp:Transcript_44369/g.73607  ORF Transcript_44369/g.73607 Transcript_44369/m.73607 type:complete len:226 (-) Transcript_44369:217-894(-)